MHLVSRVTATADSPMAWCAELVAQRAGVRDLLDLGQAAPPYPPAPEVVEHVADVARDPGGAAYAGGAGLPHLREVFAAELSRDYRARVEADDVVVTAGANQAFCLTVAALTEPGDEVVQAAPYYFNHDMWLRMTGVRPRYLEPGPDLVPSAAAAEQMITPRTRAVVLVTPGNPTGVTIPPDMIDAFADLARRRDLVLILDETYRSFRDTDVADEPPHGLFARPRWGDTVVSLHSFSKDLALPGYRVGALVAAPELRRQVLKLLDCVVIGAPRVGQEAAWAGLTRAGAWRAARARDLAAGRAALAGAMAARPGGFELLACGGFFGWLRHPFADRSTEDVVRELVTGHDVLVIPGTAFEPADRRTLRASVGPLDERAAADLGERLRAMASASSSSSAASSSTGY